MIYLMDMGTHFEMIYKKQRTSIRYGEYTLALANTDFGKMQDKIEEYLDLFTRQFEIATTLGYTEQKHSDTVKKYASYGIYPNAVNEDIVHHINFWLYKPLLQFLDNSYLKKTQLRIITNLIITELENNIKMDTFDWQDKSTYVPSVLTHKKLKEQLENILLRDSNYFSKEIQKGLFNKIISSSIFIDKNGIARTVYLIQDTLAFMMVDLQKYLAQTKTVLRCENPDCKRLFYPLSNKNKHYCRLKHNGSKLTCEEIMHRKATDDFAAKSRDARGIQQGFINNAIAHRDNPKYEYDYKLLDNLYQLWQEECSKQMILFRAKNDIDGFKDWIKDTRFTVQRLEQLGVRNV